MQALIAVTLTCWLCALIAQPRRPLHGGEVAELVYARLLGRQQRIALLASVVTLALTFALLVAHTPHPLSPPSDLHARDRMVSTDREAILPTCDGDTCYELQPGGAWLVVRKQGDGTWRGMATVTTLPRR